MKLTWKAGRMFAQLACRDEAILKGCTLHSLPTPPPCTMARFTQFPVRQLQMALPDRPIKASAHHQQAGIFGGGRSYDILVSLLITPKGKLKHLLHTGANKQTQVRKWRLDTDIALGQDRIGQDRHWRKADRYWRSSLSPWVFSIGEQTVKNVDNLLGSGVT